ncbi:unnamed protein product, partial [Symbiodinium natans]
VCVRHATPERRNGRRRWHGMVDGGSERQRRARASRRHLQVRERMPEPHEADS